MSGLRRGSAPEQQKRPEGFLQLLVSEGSLQLQKDHVIAESVSQRDAFDPGFFASAIYL